MEFYASFKILTISDSVVWPERANSCGDLIVNLAKGVENVVDTGTTIEQAWELANLVYAIVSTSIESGINLDAVYSDIASGQIWKDTTDEQFLVYYVDDLVRMANSIRVQLNSHHTGDTAQKRWDLRCYGHDLGYLLVSCYTLASVLKIPLDGVIAKVHELRMINGDMFKNNNIPTSVSIMLEHATNF